MPINRPPEFRISPPPRNPNFPSRRPDVSDPAGLCPPRRRSQPPPATWPAPLASAAGPPGPSLAPAPPRPGRRLLARAPPPLSSVPAPGGRSRPATRHWRPPHLVAAPPGAEPAPPSRRPAATDLAIAAATPPRLGSGRPRRPASSSPSSGDPRRTPTKNPVTSKSVPVNSDSRSGSGDIFG